MKPQEIYHNLKANCPQLILVDKSEESEAGIDMIYAGGVFPLHLLPVGDMSFTHLSGSDLLSFTYEGEDIRIHRTSKNNIGALKLLLASPHGYWIYLQTKASALGLTLERSGLYKEETLLPSSTEKEIVEALGLKFLEPSERLQFSSIQI